jgi:hypothetical protein
MVVPASVVPSADALPKRTVAPDPMLTVPVKVLAPFNAVTPEEFKARLPAPVPPFEITPPIVVFPVPATVNVRPVLLNDRLTLLKVTPPEFVFVMVNDERKVTGPLTAKAPAPPTVMLLLRLKALVRVRAVASVAKVAPLLMVTAPEPSAASLATTIPPAPRVKPPENVFAPESVTVPLSDLVTLPVPLTMLE